MCRKLDLIQKLEKDYSEHLEMLDEEGRDKMLIAIMSSMLIKLDDDLDFFRKTWKREMSVK